MQDRYRYTKLSFSYLAGSRGHCQYPLLLCSEGMARLSQSKLFAKDTVSANDTKVGLDLLLLSVPYRLSA